MMHDDWKDEEWRPFLALSPIWSSASGAPQPDLPEAALAAALRRAELLIGEDPDSAAVLLDGSLLDLARMWYRRRGRAMPARHALLRDLEWHAPPLAWQFRLALRAPNAHARLVHCRNLLNILGGLEDIRDVPADRGARYERTGQQNIQQNIQQNVQYWEQEG